MSADIPVALIGLGGALGAGLVGIGGTVLGILLTQRDARRRDNEQRKRFIKDRLWESRRVAYAEIIAHVRQFEKYAVLDSEGYNDPQSNPHAHDESKWHAQLLGRAHDGLRAANLAFDRHRLMLSDDFVLAFERFRFETEDADEYDPPTNAADHARAAEKGFKSLLAVAQSEVASDRE